ncbi:EF-hand domain-containing protein [uncultured Caulobacter sp.]|uniref:EF-hand domain-containing protein n=1 Tax=uncultured Caulobacter sp. TaxID=158749 RepID=UPI002631CFE5|nr:EF-hand domain-containing protein [uncultured Caulobacter sp.]
MSVGKPPKKSEVLEVRLPHETKAAFMARCHGAGRTASEAVRVFIDQELAGKAAKPARSPGPLWRALIAALAGLAVGAVAVPSLARPTAVSRATFERLDKNHDGVLSFEEFSRR